MRKLSLINKIFNSNRIFVYYIIHTQYLKTRYLDYFEFAHLFIAKELNLKSSLHNYLTLPIKVIGHKKTKDQYEIYEYKDGLFGLPKIDSFNELIISLLSNIKNPISNSELLNQLYDSDKSELIQLALKLEKSKDALDELFILTKKFEFKTTTEWVFDDIYSNSCNFKLLALNPKVWNDLFDDLSFSFYLDALSKKITYLKNGELNQDDFNRYITSINKLIIEMFNDISKNNMSQSEISKYSCNICGGDEETGCLYFDPSECPNK